MQALGLQRFPAGVVLLLSSALVAVGCCIAASSRDNDINRAPLLLLFTFAGAPVLSAGCVVVMWAQRTRPRWLTVAASLLALPQLFVCCGTVWWMLHYLGFMR
jgi:hypothetical protein